jgi:plastocyanin
LDKELLYISVFLILTAIGGEVIRNYYGAVVFVSSSDFFSFAGYIMLAIGIIALIASYSKRPSRRVDSELLAIGLFLILTSLAGEALRAYLGAPLVPPLSDGLSIIGFLILASGIVTFVFAMYRPGPRPSFKASVALGTLAIVLAASLMTGFVAAPHVVKATGSTPTGFITIALGASSGASTPQTYVPDNVVVIIGKNNTVEWTNKDTNAHTVTSLSGPTSFNSGILSSGATFVEIFSQPGKYVYHCQLHSWMMGTVTVMSS